MNKESAEPARVETSGQPVTFRDRKFKSRIVVFPDASTTAIEKSAVTVSKTGYIAYLDEHADFERIEVGR
jgi:hypothetical protein